MVPWWLSVKIFPAIQETWEMSGSGRAPVCESESVSHVWLFATPWTVAHQAPLVHGILQAKILEWVAIAFPRGSFWPRDRTQVSCIAGRFFTIWTTREAPISSVPKHKKGWRCTGMEPFTCKFPIFLNSEIIQHKNVLLELKKKKEPSENVLGCNGLISQKTR